MILRLAVFAAALLCGPAAAAQDLVAIPGGVFAMGDEQGDANEAPRRVSVARFRIMRLEVTNRQFTAFVAATGYRTDVEGNGEGHVWTDRWRQIAGADWRHPHGPEDSISRRGAHPVVQVSAHDAASYCAWRGWRLPSEREWEFAASGLEGRRYPWGNEAPAQGGAAPANFGTLACCAADDTDGHLRTAPVGVFPAGASPFGAHDMAGNVWEWTASRFPARRARSPSGAAAGATTPTACAPATATAIRPISASTWSASAAPRMRSDR